MVDGLVIPPKLAVMKVVPIFLIVTTPVEETVATVVSELAQVTLVVMSAEEPSEYNPMAVHCCV